MELVECLGNVPKRRNVAYFFSVRFRVNPPERKAEDRIAALWSRTHTFNTLHNASKFYWCFYFCCRLCHLFRSSRNRRGERGSHRNRGKRRFFSFFPCALRKIPKLDNLLP